ncbi:MAG TPA: hypothetical protein VNT77_06255 [Allosphingosinicella sp.]|nr:hypothetical protein [Allosphingosinicella sp.]
MMAPLGMAGGSAAMAHAPAAAMAQHDAHCAGSEAPGEDADGSTAMLDCMSICSAIAEASRTGLAHKSFAAEAAEQIPSHFTHGIHPESEPPPPRFS